VHAWSKISTTLYESIVGVHNTTVLSPRSSSRTRCPKPAPPSAPAHRAASNQRPRISHPSPHRRRNQRGPPPRGSACPPHCRRNGSSTGVPSPAARHLRAPPNRKARFAASRHSEGRSRESGTRQASPARRRDTYVRCRVIPAFPPSQPLRAPAARNSSLPLNHARSPPIDVAHPRCPPPPESRKFLARRCRPSASCPRHRCLPRSPLRQQA
jgi:hypothetical protein